MAAFAFAMARIPLTRPLTPWAVALLATVGLNAGCVARSEGAVRAGAKIAQTDRCEVSSVKIARFREHGVVEIAPPQGRVADVFRDWRRTRDVRLDGFSLIANHVGVTIQNDPALRSALARPRASVPTTMRVDYVAGGSEKDPNESLVPAFPGGGGDVLLHPAHHGEIPDIADAHALQRQVAPWVLCVQGKLMDEETIRPEAFFARWRTHDPMVTAQLSSDQQAVHRDRRADASAGISTFFTLHGPPPYVVDPSGDGSAREEVAELLRGGNGVVGAAGADLERQNAGAKWTRPSDAHLVFAYAHIPYVEPLPGPGEHRFSLVSHSKIMDADAGCL